MNNPDFLSILKERAGEQQAITSGMIFPRVFTFVVTYLGIHPWRILIPLALILSCILELVFGKSYDDVILKIFGGFGLIKINL